MSALEAHPIAQQEVSDEEQPDSPAQAPAEADQLPADATDAQASPDVLYDAPRESAVPETVPTSVTAPVTAALPPKDPHSKLSPAEVQGKQQAESQAPYSTICRIPSSGRFRGKGGVTRLRTFTSRPPEGCTHQINRADYTHNEARLVDIARETRSLVTRLERIYGRHVGSAIVANSPPRGKPCNEAPTQRNRRLFSDKVAAENLRIYNRLQAVKPSKDTAASQLRKEWAAAQKYSRNCANTTRKMKGRSPARCDTQSHRAQSYAEATMDHSAAAEPAPVLHVTVPSTVNEPAAEPPAAAESHPIDIEA